MISGFQWFTYCDSFPFLGILNFNHCPCHLTDHKRRGFYLSPRWNGIFRWCLFLASLPMVTAFLTPVQHMDLAIFFWLEVPAPGFNYIWIMATVLTASLLPSPLRNGDISVTITTSFSGEAICSFPVAQWKRWQILRESSVMTFAVLELKHRRGAA